MENTGGGRAFCRAYLRCMDPERAAAETGCGDGFGQLAAKPVRQRLERMRSAAAEQIRREDVLRQLARLAFGRADDAVRLALQREKLPEGLDLSAVTEVRITDKGGVEVKLADRIRALEVLWDLLGQSGGGGELHQLLAQAQGEGVWEDG